MLRRTFLFLSVLALAAGPALAVEYTITDLGHLGGAGYGTVAYAVNELGQVTGYSADSGGHTRAFLWDNGTMTNLGTVGSATSSYGYGINNAGTVVGMAYDNVQYAMSWGSVTGMSYLSIGTASSQANAVNNNGMVAGYGYFNDHMQAVLYDLSAGTFTELGSVAGFASSSGNDINNNGEMVGNSYDAVNAPFLYDGTTLTDLTTLIAEATEANAINDNGWIVGRCSTGSTAYLYNTTTSVDLGLMAGGSDYTYAKDINNTGLVVGYSTFNRDPQKAFLYDSSTATISDLYTLLDASGQAAWSELTTATAINDAGQIVGCGVTSGGAYRAFIMTPVPEPSTLTLAALGLVGLLCYGWRKRK